MKKQIHPAVSEHFRKMQEKSWKKRQQKMIDEANKSKVAQSIKKTGIDI